MASIKASVGKGGINDPLDVQYVEERLSQHRRWLAPMPALLPDGNCDQGTIEAILKFQGTAAALEKSRCDGVVSAHGFTLKRLEMGVIPFPKHAVFDGTYYDRSGGLTQTDFDKAAKMIDCEAAVIQALAAQEIGDRGAWNDSRKRPTILFERHYFSQLTNGVWDKTHPDISNESGGGYSLYRIQYEKLFRAATLDESAALKSASWGLFQITGRYQVGYPSVEAFVTAMLTSEQDHLNALVAYVNANAALKKAFQSKDWQVIAKKFNGPNYAKNKYDTSLAGHYATLVPSKPVIPKAAPSKVAPAVKTGML
jgi:N-acetylmuramidase